MNKKRVSCLDKCGIDNQEEFSYLFDQVMENKNIHIYELDIDKVYETLENEIKEEQKAYKTSNMKKFFRKV